MFRGSILLATSNFPRWQGDSTTPFVLHLAQDLQELGWKIRVLAPHAPGTLSRETLHDVEVRRFRYLVPESLETVCYQGGALINLRQNRANKLKLPALVLAEWLNILRELITDRVDLLHSHWILPQGFTGCLAAGPRRCPHIVTVHGGDIFALRGAMLNRFKKFALNHADAVTANSSWTEQAVRALVPAHPAIRRIPMGTSPPTSADTMRTTALRQRYRRGQGPLLLFVGRLVEEKGVGDLLRAVALLAPRLPDVSALIVGEGQDRVRFEALAAALGISGRVCFAGWVDAGELPSWYRASDIFVGPSKQSPEGWVEAQGLTFIEAMMAGVPVVASRSGGIVDAVRHEETGLLINEGAPEELALAAHRLHTEKEMAGRLVENAARFARTNFSRRASAEAFSNLFEELLRKRRGECAPSARPA